MPYELLYNRLPKIAERETRNIIITEDSDLGLPAGQYGFLEMFCNEPGCDCRRVFFHVVHSNRIRSQLSWLLLLRSNRLPAVAGRGWGGCFLWNDNWRVEGWGCGFFGKVR